MSTEVEFLLLESNGQWLTSSLTSLSKLYLEHERVLVISSQQQQLEQLDEVLWHNSAEQFIPYSLDSECYANSTPVLLTTNQPERLRFKALLNLSDRALRTPEQFRAIIEIVPVDDKEKEAARERYKTYRHLGYKISHRTINISEELK
jgi:DNA polymerase-3 subunit chi